MKTLTARERLFASTIFCGVAFAGLSATDAAAQAAAGPSGGAQVSEIVVTGSRIPTPNLTSTSPVTAVTSQELKLEGTTNVENLLNNLPQVFATQSSGVSNAASGTATVSLRGLGARRTMVLVNGRRLMPGDPSSAAAVAPDLNTIPAALVDRVDVLTGGASAVYGSDAVAGVVNFVMNRNFEGFRIDAQYSGYQHHNANSEAQHLLKTAPFAIPLPASDVWDGQTADITAMFGVNAPDGKGNITAYAGYRSLRPVVQADRDYSACSVAATSTSDSTVYDAHVCAGSGNSAYGRFRNENLPRSGVSVDPAGSAKFVPFTNALRFNYAPTNYFQRPDQRYTAGYFAEYAMNKTVKLYSDFMFADDHTVAQIAPSGLFAGTGANGLSTFGINCNNPLMTAAQQNAICGANGGTSFVQQTTVGFRFASLPRQDDLRHTSYIMTVGSKGELAEGWNYDAYLQYGTSIFNEHYNNDVSVARVQNALLVDPVTGQCMSGGNCVPLNIFRAGALTPAMLGYVIAPGFKSGQNAEQIASVSVTGDLGKYGVKLPWANDGVGVAFGTEYRRDLLELRVDSEFNSGDLSGQGGPARPNAGSFDVYELFGEARVPVAQDMPFAKDLNLEVGYRFSDYSTAAGTTSAYKVAGNWTINEDLKLRGGYNRAVRAPNVVEMFAPQAVALFSGNDFCASGSVSRTNCLASGATPGQLTAGITQCPAAQCTALLGGNPNLEAEKADTYTLGVVFRPHWLPGFDLTLDYFDIKVANLISAFPQLTVIDCLRNGSASSCAKFHRDPSTGSIFGNQGYVVATNTNAGYLKTSGVDVAANYRTNFSNWGLGEWGGLGFNLIGTYTQHYITQPLKGSSTFDCAGLYGVVCSSNANFGPTPKWRHKFRVTWTTPWPLTVSLDWRHVSGVKFDVNDSNNFLRGVVRDVPDATIHAYNWFDLSGTWKVRDTVTLRAGVSNLFDKDPPILDSNGFPASGPPGGNGNGYPGTYDALGRTVFFGLTADF